jgi:hypothetical protein
MLVENKFIYISLPRCASSSFHISCVRNNLDIKFAKKSENNQYYNLSLSNQDLIESVTHLHERIHEMDIAFGEQYEIISVKRDRYERFISFWKFFIERSKIYGDYVYNIVKSLKIEDILSFDPSDLDKEKVHNAINLFLRKHNLIDNVDEYFKNLIFILWQPTFRWHNNDKRIIWFDFNKLNEMEEWISNKIDKPFKLEKCNSTSMDIHDLPIDENFIEKYNMMYDRFDLLKDQKTII